MKLLIIYHSLTGHNKAMAEAIAKGAKEAGAKADLEKAKDAEPKDILGYDAVIFGSPTYFGYMAGSLKKFFDKAFADLETQDRQMPYAVFGCGGSQGGGPAIESIEKICDGFGGKFGKFRFKKIAQAISATESPAPEDLAKCSELGKQIAWL
jgi:multimeric flavodoxin WrbA